MGICTPLQRLVVPLSSKTNYSIPQSKLLGAILSDFAKKYPMLKILKIPSDQCIENYPDKLVPTILVYGPNEFRSQIVGLTDLNGNKTRVKGIAILELLTDPDLEMYAERIGALTESELRVVR